MRLLVAGTTSDAGKTVVVTALCRAFARRGIRVAPYKAQNMSNNSAVTVDGDDRMPAARQRGPEEQAGRTGTDDRDPHDASRIMTALRVH